MFGTPTQVLHTTKKRAALTTGLLTTGKEGFEPPMPAPKTRALTAWRLPNNGNDSIPYSQVCPADCYNSFFSAACGASCASSES